MTLHSRMAEYTGLHDLENFKSLFPEIQLMSEGDITSRGSRIRDLMPVLVTENMILQLFHADHSPRWPQDKSLIESSGEILYRRRGSSIEIRDANGNLRAKMGAW